jgi:hypothetical protein
LSRRAWWLLLAGLALLLLVVACSATVIGLAGRALVDLDQPSYNDGLVVEVGPDQPVGQTFVARHAGLCGIEFFLTPPGDRPLSLELHVRPDAQSANDLATAVLDLPPGSPPGFYRFSFSPLSDSHGQYYYAFFTARAAGAKAALAGEDAYLDGAAYQDHQPLDAQAAFHLVYATRYVVLDLLGAALGGIGLLAAGGLLFVVPGWALLSWLSPARRWAWAELLGLAVGVSLALYPVLMLWTHSVGANLGPLYVWVPVGAGLAMLVWRYRTWRPWHGWQVLRGWARSEALWPDLTLLFVLGLVFGVRLLVVRGLEAPMWGDGYQHTMIAQLLVDHGGLFESWRPYAALDQFTYHFGFHSAVAVLHWLTGFQVVEATVWTGQILNALAALCLYPLALRISGSRWAGTWAVLLAGLLSAMPMFYVNWGRYTELAGLVILPAAVWLTWEMIDAVRVRWQQLALVIVAASGLALTHYRVLLFYGFFALGLFFVSLVERSGRRALWRLAWAGSGTALLCLPWFLNTLGSTLQQLFYAYVTTPPGEAHPFLQQYNSIGDLRTYLAPVWWLALVAGLGLGLWQRRRGILLIALWWLLLLIAANPAWFSLPGTGTITNFALFIAAYVPAGLAAGYLAARMIEHASRRSWVPALAMVLALGAGVWGASQRLSDLDPRQYALVTRPDIRAAAWIGENTPSDARFLINSFSAYGDTSVVGADGGWWLPLLAGRQTTVPPLNYSIELGLESDYRQRIRELTSQDQQTDWDDQALLALFEREKITYVYVGQRRGEVNNSSENVINPQDLVKSANYTLVYHQDQVWIFQVGS